MTRWKKWLTLSLGVVVLILITLSIVFWFLFIRNEVASTIANFHPENFEARAAGSFFYSIDNELKYSDHIALESPTLIRGEIQDFLVSPDKLKIAVVTNGKLVIVGTQSILRNVADVDSIFREPKPIGQQFFRDDDFQWSRDSKSLYLIRDEYYDSRGSQLFSKKGELWKYEIESGTLSPALKPFPAFSYFLGLKAIYFSVPTDQGDLQLRRFDETGTVNVDEANASDIPRKTLAKDFVESPFYSFSLIDYQNAVLPSKGVDLVIDGQTGPERLVIGGKSFLVLTQGNNFKGPYYCSDLLRSVFLPGDRYFLFNTPYCGNYGGQLLIDVVSGRYQQLPKQSVVYLTANTDTYPHYRITGGGIVIKKDGSMARTISTVDSSFSVAGGNLPRVPGEK